MSWADIFVKGERRPLKTERSHTSRKQDATRQRLIDAAVRRFREHGYATTTAAAIAEDAGVTERTFFRYFPTKADALVANWELHGDALRAALARAGEGELIDVIRKAMLVYAERVRAEIGDALDSVARVVADPAAFLALMATVLAVEHDLAAEIGRRSGRSDNDFLVRVTANACVGVFRAALRAAVMARDVGRVPVFVNEGMDRVRGLFDALATP